MTLAADKGGPAMHAPKPVRRRRAGYGHPGVLYPDFSFTPQTDVDLANAVCPILSCSPHYSSKRRLIQNRFSAEMSFTNGCS
jgi:hypothetical protein